MNLLWVAFTKFHQGFSGLTSDAASARYRILLPVQYLQQKGHQIALAAVTENVLNPALVSHLVACDAVVFSKSFLHANEELARHAKERGVKIVFDVCDNHFLHPQRGAHYRAMTQLADGIICSTEAMSDIVKQYSDAPCMIIDDPYEGIRQPPSFIPQDNLKLVWFGHASNLDGLLHALPSLREVSSRFPLSLSIVTQLSPEQEKALAIEVRARVSGAVSVYFIAWSQEAQQQTIYASDVVLIPSLTNEIKQVKSPNRMVESLQAGKMVVASPLPSYLPFGDWAYLGDNMAEGIAWVMEHRNEIPDRINAAQNYIETRFSPPLIGEKWHHALERISGGGKPA